mgnify:CR=1 FL=1
MELSLQYNEFKDYVLRQMNYLFPDNQSIDLKGFGRAFDIAIDRTHFCFKHVTLGSYCKNGNTYLNHLHSDQYAVFLWFLSNSVWFETNDDKLSNKLFYMNKTLNGLSCMYDTKLPDIFLLLQPMDVQSGLITGSTQESERE